MQCQERIDSEAKQVHFQIRLKDKRKRDSPLFVCFFLVVLFGVFLTFGFFPSVSSESEGLSLSLLSFLVKTPAINLIGK